MFPTFVTGSLSAEPLMGPDSGTNLGIVTFSMSWSVGSRYFFAQFVSRTFHTPFNGRGLRK